MNCKESDEVTKLKSHLAIAVAALERIAKPCASKISPGSDCDCLSWDDCAVIADDALDSISVDE